MNIKLFLIIALTTIISIQLFGAKVGCILTTVSGTKIGSANFIFQDSDTMKDVITKIQSKYFKINNTYATKIFYEKIFTNNSVEVLQQPNIHQSTLANLDLSNQIIYFFASN